MPATPVILQTPVPDGATALDAPVTVAVKIIVEPKVPVPALAFTATVGLVWVTAVLEPDVGEVAA